MIITLKTLQEDLFTVEIDPSQTVRCFKEKIEKVKGKNYPAKSLKLMYGGKFLLDSNKVSDYSLEEKKFVIIVMKQLKTRKPFARGDPSPFEAAIMNATNDRSERDRMLRADHELLVQHIVELGFSRTEVELALRESYNNPEQAIDFLINNIVAGVSRRTPLVNSPVVITTQSGPDLDMPDAHLMRQMTQDPPPTPSISSPLPNQERILEIFGDAIHECENDAVAMDRLIEANRDRIFQVYAEMEAAGITDPHGLLSQIQYTEYNSDSQDDEDDTDDNEDSFQNELMEPSTFRLLERDRGAIERLKQLGFTDEKAIEAFLVCEKNENVAAEYLFTQNQK